LQIEKAKKAYVISFFFQIKIDYIYYIRYINIPIYYYTIYFTINLIISILCHNY